MDVTKPYEFIGFGAMDVTKPDEFTGFGVMDAAFWGLCGRLRGTPRARVGRAAGRVKIGYAVNYDSGGDQGIMKITNSWLFLMT